VTAAQPAPGALDAAARLGQPRTAASPVSGTRSGRAPGRASAKL